MRNFVLICRWGNRSNSCEKKATAPRRESERLVNSTEFVPKYNKNFAVRIVSATLEALTSSKAKRLATATSKLFMRHVLWHDVMMMCGFTRSGVLLNLVLLLIFLNPPLAASKRGGNRQPPQEERQSEFVKGKSKRNRLCNYFCPNVESRIILTSWNLLHVASVCLTDKNIFLLPFRKINNSQMNWADKSKTLFI